MSTIDHFNIDGPTMRAFQQQLDAEIAPLLTDDPAWLDMPPAATLRVGPAAGTTTTRRAGLTANTEAISLRMPHKLIAAIRDAARGVGMPYQTLIILQLLGSAGPVPTK